MGHLFSLHAGEVSMPVLVAHLLNLCAVWYTTGCLFHHVHPLWLKSHVWNESIHINILVSGLLILLSGPCKLLRLVKEEGRNWGCCIGSYTIMQIAHHFYSSTSTWHFFVPILNMLQWFGTLISKVLLLLLRECKTLHSKPVLRIGMLVTIPCWSHARRHYLKLCTFSRSLIAIFLS